MAVEPITDRLAVLFEGAPRYVARLRAEAARAGVTSLGSLLERAEQIAFGLPEEEQVELLNAHPRIGAGPASVSTLSFREQGYDRDPGTAELAARLKRLNDQYERRFGFRCVIFVAGRPRSEIAGIIERQLRADRSAELRRGLADVIAIARDRAARLEQETPA